MPFAIKPYSLYLFHYKDFFHLRLQQILLTYQPMKIILSPPLLNQQTLYLNSVIFYKTVTKNRKMYANALMRLF